MSLVADHVGAAGTRADVEEALALLCEPDVPLDDQAIAAAIDIAVRAISRLLMKAPTTAAGLQLLQAVVTDRSNHWKRRGGFSCRSEHASKAAAPLAH